MLACSKLVCSESVLWKDNFLISFGKKKAWCSNSYKSAPLILSLADTLPKYTWMVSRREALNTIKTSTFFSFFSCFSFFFVCHCDVHSTYFLCQRAWHINIMAWDFCYIQSQLCVLPPEISSH